MPSLAQAQRHTGASRRQARYSSERPAIVSIGLTVHGTPVSLREKVAVPEAEWAGAISELVSLPHVDEAAVLSTCNRMEVYVHAVSWERGAMEVVKWMAKYGGVAVADLVPHLFVLRDGDASQHLLRVASGLESLVLGEGQILSQVKNVYATGQDIEGFGRNLNGLFKQAVTCGKRARSECRLSEGAVSVSSAAVELVATKLREATDSEATIGDARVLVVGAGVMSRLLVKHAASKGVTKLSLVNRSAERANALAADFPDLDIAVKDMGQLVECVDEADVVFVASGAMEPLLTKAQCGALSPASQAVRGRRSIVDISVPRNVHEDVGLLDDVSLYNVDDLRQVVEANQAERSRRAQLAEGVLTEELATFSSWRDSLETVPTIKRLRAMAEDMRALELDKCLGKMGEGLTKKERKAVEELSRGLVNKLLHGPMQALRSDGDERTVAVTIRNMHALERMFDLDKIADEEARVKVQRAMEEKKSGQ